MTASYAPRDERDDRDKDRPGIQAGMASSCSTSRPGSGAYARQVDVRASHQHIKASKSGSAALAPGVYPAGVSVADTSASLGMSGLQLKRLDDALVQFRSVVMGRAANPLQVADQGAQGSGSQLPYLDKIQASFGRHDVSNVQAFTGTRAQSAARDLGAHAYAMDNRVVLGSKSDLHTVAHEAAHVIQQRGGVSLKGGVGEAGDRHEQHADRVADLVVQGKSAEELLDSYASANAPQVGLSRTVQLVRIEEQGDEAANTAQGILAGDDPGPIHALFRALRRARQTRGQGSMVVRDILDFEHQGTRWVLTLSRRDADILWPSAQRRHQEMPLSPAARVADQYDFAGAGQESRARGNHTPTPQGSGRSPARGQGAGHDTSRSDGSANRDAPPRQRQQIRRRTSGIHGLARTVADFLSSSVPIPGNTAQADLVVEAAIDGVVIGFALQLSAEHSDQGIQVTGRARMGIGAGTASNNANLNINHSLSYQAATPQGAGTALSEALRLKLVQLGRGPLPDPAAQALASAILGPLGNAAGVVDTALRWWQGLLTRDQVRNPWYSALARRVWGGSFARTVCSTGGMRPGDHAEATRTVTAGVRRGWTPEADGSNRSGAELEGGIGEVDRTECNPDGTPRRTREQILNFRFQLSHRGVQGEASVRAGLRGARARDEIKIGATYARQIAWPALCQYLAAGLQHIVGRVIQRVRQRSQNRELLRALERTQHEIPAIQSALLAAAPRRRVAVSAELTITRQEASVKFSSLVVGEARLPTNPAVRAEGTLTRGQTILDLPLWRAQ